MRARSLSPAALALALLGALPAGAAGRVLVPLDGPRKATRLVEKALLEALQRAGKEARLASLPLEDIRIAVDCMDDSIECIQQIARSLEADELLLGSVAVDAERGFVVSLRRFEGSGAPGGVIEFALKGAGEADVQAAAEGVRQLMERSGAEDPGVLEIRVEPALDDVEISVGGHPRGSAPVRLEGLPPQRYIVTARRDGFFPWQGEVVVLAGRTVTAKIRLERAPAGRDRDALHRVRPRTWYTAAAAGVLLGTGTLFAALARASQNAVDDEAVRTREDYDGLSARADAGEPHALIANVALGAGAATLVAAGVMGALDARASKRVAVSAAPGGFAVAW